jgi:dTDP-4-amino-4,6-dideoxygalactose transaminase
MRTDLGSHSPPVPGSAPELWNSADLTAPEDIGAARRILLSGPDVTDAEKGGLLRAFESGYIAAIGPDLDAFEREVADFCRRRHGVATANGTTALHLALIAAGVRPGDAVVTATMTFAATANAIRHAGAEPVFVDCDRTGNIDPDIAREATAALRLEGRRVGAVLPVDLLGKAAAHDRIAEWADDLRIPVVVDAAEGLGARLHGQPAGSFGLAAALSFNGNKPITTTSGGMLLTDDEGLAGYARKLASQAREPVPWYQHAEVGYNYRLSNLLAGLGREQLKRLPAMLERRRAVREHYRALFADVPGVTVFDGGSDEADSCWLTSILVDAEATGWTPRDLIEALDRDNIEARHLWKPMHLQPAYEGSTYFTREEGGRGGESVRLFEQGVTLPSSSALGPDDLHRISESVEHFLHHRQ